MKLCLFFNFIFFLFIPNHEIPQSFKEQQLKFSRVKGAYERKSKEINELLKEKKISGSYEIFIRAFKKEGQAEVWIKNKNKRAFTLFKKYKICRASGILGPKSKKGDYQVPEGFYFIARFNPASNFHLSLGLSYPNNADKIRSKEKDLGGDIFIHGDCVTIGCIPLQDQFIEEMYLMAIEAKNSGQSNIQVHIFPSILNEENFSLLKDQNPKNQELLIFWANLKEGFDYFEANHILPSIAINNKGSYTFK